MLLRYWPPSAQLPRIIGANGATQGEAVASAVMSGVLFAIVGNARSGSGMAQRVFECDPVGFEALRHEHRTRQHLSQICCNAPLGFVGNGCQPDLR